MKKFLALVFASALTLSLVACGNKDAAESTEETAVVAEETAETEDVVLPAEEETEASEESAYMTYADYAATAVDEEVTVKVYVQATQSWWDNTITVYAADADGAYFIYNMACTEEDAAKLVPGTEIIVTGVKGEWEGEVEIMDATFEFGTDATFEATAVDATAALGTDAITDYMNQKVSFTDMTVEAVSYKNNEPGDDIYVTLSKDGNNYEFCLEYYLNGSDEEFYNTVGNLEVGATVDVECFLYFYQGPDGHLTKVTVK
jgi:hypothetical protein